jgi:hypothetical protein
METGEFSLTTFKINTRRCALTPTSGKAYLPKQQKVMWNRKLKDRLSNLENELAGLKAELAELKRTLAQVLSENHFLRAERDRFIAMSGIAPAFPIVKRHEWSNAEAETRQNGL